MIEAPRVRPSSRSVVGVLTATVAAVAALGLFGPQPTDAEVGAAYIDTGVLTTVGADTGNAFALTACPRGSIATGAQAQESQPGWAGMYSLLCRQITATGLSSGVRATQARGTDWVFTTPLAQVACPAGQVITGMHLVLADPVAPALSETHLRCGAFEIVSGVPRVGGSSSEVRSSFTAGGAAVGAGSFDCAQGQFVIGFEGRQSAGLDRFTPHCARLSATTLVAELAVGTWAMPSTGFALAVRSAGGTAPTVISSGVPTPLWPGTYDTDLVVPQDVRPEWVDAARTGSCVGAVLSEGASATCTITLNGRPDSAVAVDAPESATTGTAVGVTIHSANVGPAAGTPTIALDATLPFIVDWPAACVLTTATTCTLAPLAAAAAPGLSGGARDVFASISFAGEGVTTLTASVSTPGDAYPWNDVAVADISVSPVETTTSAPSTTGPPPPATTITPPGDAPPTGTSPNEPMASAAPTSSIDGGPATTPPDESTPTSTKSNGTSTSGGTTKTTTTKTTTNTTNTTTNTTAAPHDTSTGAGPPSTGSSNGSSAARTPSSAAATATSTPNSTAHPTPSIIETEPGGDTALGAEPGTARASGTASATTANGIAAPQLTDAGELPEIDPGTGSALGPDGSRLGSQTEIGPGTISVTGDGIAMQVTTRDPRADSTTGVVVWAGKEAEVTGTGFAPSTSVSVWMFSAPRQLGSVAVGADGSFLGRLIVPADVPSGEHTIQVTGVTAGGERRAVNAGVVIAGADATFAPYLATANAEEVMGIAGQALAVVIIAGGAMALRSSRSRRRASRDAAALTGASGDTGEVDNATMLAPVDFEIEGTEDGDMAWGDASRSWRWPWTSWVDERAGHAERRLATKMPLLGRVLADGDFLRAALGGMWVVMPVLGVVLGSVWTVQVSGEVLPPSTWLLSAILVLGILDAGSGLVALATFASGAVVSGGVDSASALRGLLGLGVLAFGVSLTAGSLRPLRYEPDEGEHSRWVRAADVAVGSLFGAWTAELMVQALPGMLGLDVPIARAASRIAWVALGALLLRFAGEAAVQHLYPRRLTVSVATDLPEPTRSRMLIAMLVRVALFTLITAAITGTGPLLWIATLIFAVPQVLMAFADDLPNGAMLYRYVPRGVLMLTIVMVAEFAWATWLSDNLANPSQVVSAGFVLLLLPSTLFLIANLVVREGPDWPLRWTLRVSGLVVVVFALLFSRWSLWSA